VLLPFHLSPIALIECRFLLKTSRQAFPPQFLMVLPQGLQASLLVPPASLRYFMLPGMTRAAGNA
jgi:uncharacterized membrane protein YwaF